MNREIVINKLSAIRLMKIPFFIIVLCLCASGQEENQESAGDPNSIGEKRKQKNLDASKSLTRIIQENSTVANGIQTKLVSLKSGLARITILEELPTLTPAEERELAALKLLEVLVGRIDATLQEHKKMVKELRELRATETKMSKALEEPLIELDLSQFSDWSAGRIEGRVDEIAAEIEATENLIRSLEATEEERLERESLLPAILSAERTRLSDFTNPEPDPEAGTTLARIKRDTAIAERLLITTTIATLELEQQFLNLTANALQLRKRASTKKLAQLRKDKKDWDSFFEKTYAAETEAARAFAAQQAKRFTDIDVLAKLTRANKQLADQRKRISQKSTEAKQAAEKLASQERLIEEQRETAQERITLLESAGLNIDTSTGQSLRSQRAKLPTLRALTATLNASIRESTRAQVAFLEIRDKRDSLPVDMDAEITEILAQVPEGTIIERNEIREILDQRRELLGDMITDYKNYISILNKSAATTRLTIDEVERYSSFLDARLLWIASAERISTGDFDLEWRKAKSLASPENFKEWWLNLFDDLKSGPVLWLIIEGVLIYLVFRRKKVAAALERRGEEARQESCQKIAPTFWAIVHSLKLALPIPLTLWFLSWRVQDPVAIVAGASSLVSFFAVFGGLSVMSRPEGLLANHFGMRPEAAAHLHYHLQWFLFIAPIPKFFAAALPVASLDYSQVGRISFVILMTISLVFSHLTLRPRKRLLTGPELQHAALAKTCWLVAIGAPLLFIAGSCLGYNVSIDTLYRQASLSMDLIFATVFVALFFLRWLKTSQVRLEMRRVEQREAAEKAAQEESEGGEKGKGASLEELQANAVNSAVVEEQTTRLVRVAAIVVIGFGLWNIWSTSLTALSVMDRVKLWEGPKPGEIVAQTTAREGNSAIATKTAVTTTPEKTVDGQAEGDAAVKEAVPAAKDVEPKDESVATALSKDSDKESDPLGHWITLEDLMLAILTFILTIITARNFPGLLELTVLRRFNSKPGANYAVTMLLTYAIIAAGLMLALHRVGVTWSSLQWLAAAITLGIGFGLQEIFANFVAGIIILFEQPLRLGDIVTIDGVTGKVTRIEIRATTILQYNKKEMLVPNKDLITGTLVNWTLKDNVNRFELAVGVSYDSDPDEVTAILQEIAEQHPNIVADPPSSVLFMGFGESTLNFEIRAHVASPDNLVGTQSQLHYQIARAFKDAGITFAFPQQGLHICTMPEPATFSSEDPNGTPAPMPQHSAELKSSTG